MRKLASLLLALVLVFGLATTAFAAGGVDEPAGSTTTTGTITINNAVAGQKYTIYEILYLESYNATEGSEAYAYKATSAWKSFVESEAIKDVYLATDAQGYVTWVKDKDGKEADPAAFAKLAKAYAATNSIANQGSTTATATTVTFNNLNLGYYLVDSTLGTLCSLDTTNPSVNIQEKNIAPTNEKKVEEDSDKQYGATNDADIGQTVNFKSTITAQAGAENYVFHDKMSAGLTFGSVTGITLNGTTTVATTNYTVTTSELGDDCTFHVVFTQDFCDTLKANDQIVISYTATLNASAVVGLPGNPNESKLSYGDSSNTKYTTSSTTTTYTWDMDVLKYTMNNNEKKYLAGVKFVLIKKVPSGDTTKEQVAKFDANKKLTEWVDVPNPVNGKITWPENTTLTTNDQGKIEIDGLDSDTYYLREIETLPGFNMIGDVSVTITGATETEGEDGNKTLTYSTKTIEVENKSGTELPSTGGMGTTIFYILGSVLVLAAGVLLVTKKRMSAEN